MNGQISNRNGWVDRPPPAHLSSRIALSTNELSTPQWSDEPSLCMEHAPTINTEQIGIDLRDVDVEILELLAEGRCTPRYLSKQIGVVQQYISQRLTRLIDHELVERVDRGLYEIDCEVTHDE